MKKRLVIVGGVGGGQIAASVFADMNKVNDEWIIEGYLNDVLKPGELFGNYPVLAPSNEVLEYVEKGYYIHYALHTNAKAKKERVNLLRSLDLPEEALATAIHPSVYLMDGTTVGAGSLLAPYSMTSFGVSIGKYTHVYSGVFLGHDCVIGDYCTIAARAVVGARVSVCEGAHTGLNSCIREDVKVGEYSIIGMGAVLIADTEPNSIYVGNPAHLIGNINRRDHDSSK